MGKASECFCETSVVPPVARWGDVHILESVAVSGRALPGGTAGLPGHEPLGGVLGVVCGPYAARGVAEGLHSSAPGASPPESASDSISVR